MPPAPKNKAAESDLNSPPITSIAPGKNAKLWIALGIFCFSAILLFTGLGHYALWDDEASTALTAKGILLTGDTTAMLGQNVVAYRNGFTLRDLKDRAQPPLPAYLTAVALYFAGENAFGARVAFALCGLATIALILWWMWRDGASIRLWWITGLGIIGNVSFFLYCRQSRYYGLVILLSTAMAYLYLHWTKRWHLALLGFLSFLLFASQYMMFAAVWACLGVDFLIWGRKRRPLRWGDWIILLAPQILLGAVIFLIWNPFGTTVGDQLAKNNFTDRLTLLWWNLRELNRAEFGCGIALILAPILARRNPWVQRGVIAILIYAVVMVIVSVQPVKITFNADVRYLVPLILVCISVTALTLAQLRMPLWLAVSFGLLVFETNLLHFSFLSPTGFRSTLLSFITELKSPLPEPYTPTIEWVNKNVPKGKSIWVSPDWMVYPLMFHAPDMVYAWQLDSLDKWQASSTQNPRLAATFAQFKNLPPIHFKKEAAPDYMILFGPQGVNGMLKTIDNWKVPLRYEVFQTLDYYWQDRYRPELFWHSFNAKTNYNKETEAIYLVRLTDTNAPTASSNR